MRKLAVSAFAMVAVIAIGGQATLVSCNGGSCTVSSICPNDPPATDDQRLLCNNRIHDPRCGGYYSAMIGCTQGHQVCLADGTTDFNATNAPCNDIIAAWINCYYGGSGVPPATTPDAGSSDGG